MGLINKGGNVIDDHDENHLWKNIGNPTYSIEIGTLTINYYIFEFRQGEVFDSPDLLEYITHDYLEQLQQQQQQLLSTK